MGKENFITIDGNEAVAHVAYRLNEVVIIYPITPSSPMSEWCDQWSAKGIPNVFGTVPSVTEMQSEAGAVGAVHGALQSGVMATTFTSSQGLLLMIPNMFKIAGELTPAVFHVAARSLATHALSIFGDHSDVMAVRSTGWGLLCSNSVQEAADMALVAQAAALEGRLPFVHFFDGFRTSHEVSKLDLPTDDQIRAMVNVEKILEIRSRALSPDRPVLRGTAQNPDVFFQAREAANGFYEALPAIVEKTMDRLAEVTGRRYHIYEYHGAPDAERVIVVMGSGAETVHDTVDHMNQQGEKVGVLKVRLFRPFAAEKFVAALPASVKSIAVLDRTKEPGAAGEPLYMDVLAALGELTNSGKSRFAASPKVVGGRYGLSSKEFTPAMAKAVFDNLKAAAPKNHFTIGINDDVSHTSLPFDPNYTVNQEDVFRAIFFGLGADGTVSANKNSIKIIGENTPNWAQGYFVYDSKKSGAITVSHLRFGPNQIHAPYLINQAKFVACHQWSFIDKYDMLSRLADGGVLLLNSPHSPEKTWDALPRKVQEELIAKKAKVFVIDALTVARENGMGGRINTVMMTCFFAISGVLKRDEAIEQIKKSIKKEYGKKGDAIVAMNIKAVDATLERLYEMKVPASATSTIGMRPPVTDDAPAFVKSVLGKIISGYGDDLPVSAFPLDGTFPTATAQYEKRNIAVEVPVWDSDTCIQCGKCVMICPHAVIRMKAYDASALKGAPASFKSTDAKDKAWAGKKFTIQVSAEDCTGCALCIEVCPAKNKSETRLKAINMHALDPIRDEANANWKFFKDIPDMDRLQIKTNLIKQQQVQRPLFEFSGACGGCGETPYLKLMSQLFGDRAVVANATGCSSIYGGNLPTTPWAVNSEGRGPAWSNSLFEDNAEFGLGMRVAINKKIDLAQGLLRQSAGIVGDSLVSSLLSAAQTDEAGIFEQRARVEELKKILAGNGSESAKPLLAVADYLVKKSVWIIGGDGWAYDIGYGGLDHVIASGQNVNILVLDTEVYSNTGGQASKSTPRGAVAKFAAAGKPSGKKDLGMLAMAYGNVYVARVAMGARDDQALRAFLEAESYQGPSIIIAYAHCIAHGIDMSTGVRNQRAAVDSGQWVLFRYDPRRAENGENPLQLDSKAPKMAVREYMQMENRFNMLTKTNPEAAAKLFKEAQDDANIRYQWYEFLASRPGAGNTGGAQ